MKTPLEITKYFLDPDLEWITSGIDVQYIFLKEGTENLLIFAPSNSFQDWKNNFDFWKKPYKHMDTTFYVHRGFLKCWKSVEEEILSEIKDSCMENLTIAGWSFGGALATLATEDLWFKLPDVKTKTITFGAPKVFSTFGFKKIKERFDNMYMFKNGSDVVTKVPFNFMGFRHVAKLINIGDRPRFLDYFRPQIYHDMCSSEETGYSVTLNTISKGTKYGE